jgi:hypothetical protein
VRIKTGVVSQFPSHREVPSFAPLHTTPFHFTANKISGFVEQASKPLAAKKFRDFFVYFIVWSHAQYQVLQCQHGLLLEAGICQRFPRSITNYLTFELPRFRGQSIVLIEPRFPEPMYNKALDAYHFLLQLYNRFILVSFLTSRGSLMTPSVQTTQIVQR